MRKLALLTIIAITAVMTAIVTSLFWIAVYGVAADAPPAQDGPAPTPAQVNAALGAPPPANSGGLAIPVQGVRPNQIGDTYSQSRAGGARVHNALDIMAARGTPVVAAADGVVERLHFSRGGGGITAYVRSADGAWVHYYAHLDAYAPGLHVGQRLRRGDPIGTVGSSGNANPAGPHLHFAVHRMAPGERWYQGTPVNPYPLLAANRPPR
jgi:murein DD-endopeptidase MepM/ murein hydrolase activator NlpD